MPLLDDIKARLDIAEVIQGYVALQKAGRNFKAPCPFHNERTPSFFVFPERQTWRCFGACAAGGDVVSFVQRKEGLDFTETLHLLATRANLPVPERRSRETLDHEDLLFKVNDIAAEYYHKSLFEPTGEEALAYLSRRGLSQETIVLFRLGHSPGGSALLQHLSVKGVSPNVARDAGLVRPSGDSPLRDMFHKRLIFPIHDPRGRIVGFGGRTLGSSQPKYLNTPQTVLFDKGRILYGLHRALGSMRDSGKGIIVEGYMDAIAAHQSGFTNVVASMGTAVTEAQIALLPPQARTIVQALDPDAAGQEATVRSLENSWHRLERRVATIARKGVALMHRSQGPDLRVALLPQGKDPDQIIRESPSAWEFAVENAVPWWEFWFQVEANRHDLSSAQGKALLADSLFPVISSIENPYEQERLFSRLAELLGVSNQTLVASVGRPRSKNHGRRVTPADKANASAFRAASHDSLEEFTLALLLQNPPLRDQGLVLTVEHFSQSDNRELFSNWFDLFSQEVLPDKVSKHLQDYLSSLLVLPIPESSEFLLSQALLQCISRLEERKLREIKREESLVLGEQWVEGNKSHEILSHQDLSSTDALRQLFVGREPEP